MKSLPTSRLKDVLQIARKTLRAKSRIILPASRNPGSSHAPVPLPASIAQALQKASAAIGRVRATEGILLAIIALLGGLLATCFVDWLVHTPQPVRILLFVIQILVTGTIVWLHILRPLTRKVSNRESALLLQKKFPGLRSAPISAIELACGHGRSVVGTRPLIERLGAETAALLRSINPAAVASPNAIKKLAKIAVAFVLLNAVWIALLWPDSLTWLARWPGLRVPPPTQTIVQDITTDITANRGTNVELRARAKGVVPRSGRVRLEFTDGTTSEIPAQPGALGTNPDEFSALVTSVQTTFRYTFQLNDGAGSPHRVQVVLPPTVAKFSIRETFPAHTKLPPKDHDTGSLTFLVGSTLEIKVTATQDLKSAASTFVGANQEIPLEVSQSSPTAASGTPTVPVGVTGLSFPLVNTEGIASIADTIFRAESKEDKPPTLTLLGDASQVPSLTPTANIDLTYSCTDDFGVSQLELRYAFAKSGTPEAPAEAPPDSEFKALSLPIPTGDQATFNWLPGTLPGATSGQTVFFFLEAADNRAPDGPGITRTETRSLTLVTPTEKRLETLRRTGEAAKQIHELSEKQLDVQDDLEESSKPNEP